MLSLAPGSYHARVWRKGQMEVPELGAMIALRNRRFRPEKDNSVYKYTIINT